MTAKQRKILGAVSIIVGLGLYVYGVATENLVYFGIGSLVLFFGGPLYPRKY